MILEQERLEEWILLTVLASEDLDANTVNSFYSMMRAPVPLSERYLSPIQQLEKKRQEKSLKRTLESFGLGGKHRVLSRCLKELTEKKPNLANDPIEKLEEVYGVSQKASRLFLLFTRDEDVVCINDPIIKLVESKGMVLPKSMNTRKQYEKAEKIVRKLSEIENKTIREIQLDVFNPSLKPGPMDN